MTTRQAVLASVVGSSHVSLGASHISCCVAGNGLIEGFKDETSRKKKQLNEAEIALRREETARKRKHLSEKKLEDEKVRHFLFLTTIMTIRTGCARFSYNIQGGDDQPSAEEEVRYTE